MRFLYLISISCVRKRDNGPQGQASTLLTAYTAGLNWNVNTNVHFMLDYLHGNSVNQISPTNGGDAGGKFGPFAMRAQVAS
jgi:phosphate-selective porin